MPSTSQESCHQVPLLLGPVDLTQVTSGLSTGHLSGWSASGGGTWQDTCNHFAGTKLAVFPLLFEHS